MSQYTFSTSASDSSGDAGQMQTATTRHTVTSQDFANGFFLVQFTWPFPFKDDKYFSVARYRVVSDVPPHFGEKGYFEEHSSVNPTAFQAMFAMQNAQVGDVLEFTALGVAFA